MDPSNEVRAILRPDKKKSQFTSCEAKILQSVLAGDPAELSLAIAACVPHMPVLDVKKLENLCEIQRTPIQKLLEGSGKLKDLRSNPNLKGVDIEAILRGSPRDLRELGLSSRQLSPIKKALQEARDLGGRSGGGR